MPNQLKPFFNDEAPHDIFVADVPPMATNATRKDPNKTIERADMMECVDTLAHAPVFCSRENKLINTDNVK